MIIQRRKLSDICKLLLSLSPHSPDPLSSCTRPYCRTVEAYATVTASFEITSSITEMTESTAHCIQVTLRLLQALYACTLARQFFGAVNAGLGNLRCHVACTQLFTDRLSVGGSVCQLAAGLASS